MEYRNNSYDMPFVSVIVLNYNGMLFIKKCLESILQVNYPVGKLEIIVVDNCSTDGSLKFVEKHFPHIRILALKRNFGFSRGNNEGAKISRGDIIVFLNNDTIVDKNWLIEIVKVMMANEKIAICGSLVLPFNEERGYVGGCLHPLGGVIQEGYKKGEFHRDYYLIGSIVGTSLAIRSKIFEELGGYDNDFFLYVEDRDLCLRAWLFGYQVAFAANSTLYHFGGGAAVDRSKINIHSQSKFSSVISGRLISPYRVYYMNRNSFVFLAKNLQIKNFFYNLPFYYVYILLQLFVLLYIKENTIKLLLKAGVWPLINLRKIWRKRVKIQMRRKINDDWLVEKGLLASVSEIRRSFINIYYCIDVK